MTAPLDEKRLDLTDRLQEIIDGFEVNEDALRALAQAYDREEQLMIAEARAAKEGK